MFFNQANKKAKRLAALAPQSDNAAAGGRKLYSVPVWMQEKIFAGEFAISDKNYKLFFAPMKAEINGKTLQLHGRLSIEGSGNGRPFSEVRARLAAIQGGIGGGAPPRYRMQATGAMASQAPVKPSGLPPTESTGPTSFTAVMFFHLDALDSSKFGVPADMSHVQLNARLAPRDPLAQTLHSLYTALTNALDGEQRDAKTAALLVRELNQVLAG